MKAALKSLKAGLKSLKAATTVKLAKAPFFAMGIRCERRLAVQDRNKSEVVDVPCTMPMILHLRSGDKLQIKANQRSYGFLLL